MVPKSQSPQPKTLPNDLLEALRDLTGGITSDIQEQTGIRPRKSPRAGFPDNALVFEQQKRETQNVFEQRLRQTETSRRQEKLVYSAKEQETKARVTALQEEVKKLTQATKNLAKEVEVTAFEVPTQVGIYHENFFEKLISFIKSLTKKVEDASIWLATWNAKTKKRPFYWAQVGKSGSKFMLSQERYMSTQAG